MKIDKFYKVNIVEIEQTFMIGSVYRLCYLIILNTFVMLLWTSTPF